MIKSKFRRLLFFFLGAGFFLFIVAVTLVMIAQKTAQAVWKEHYTPLPCFARPLNLHYSHKNLNNRLIIEIDYEKNDVGQRIGRFIISDITNDPIVTWDVEILEPKDIEQIVYGEFNERIHGKHKILTAAKSLVSGNKYTLTVYGYSFTGRPPNTYEFIYEPISTE